MLASGKTPAGTHVPIMIAEILEVLDPQPGEIAVDCTLGYGGHARALLPRIQPGGTLLGLDVDPIELPKTEARMRSLGFGPDVFVARRSNFAGLPQALAAEGLAGADCRAGGPRRVVDAARHARPRLLLQDAGPARHADEPEPRPAGVGIAARRLEPAALAALLAENADEPHAVILAEALAGRPFEQTTDLADGRSRGPASRAG